jgi:hypothetical protein
VRESHQAGELALTIIVGKGCYWSGSIQAVNGGGYRLNEMADGVFASLVDMVRSRLNAWWRPALLAHCKRTAGLDSCWNVLSLKRQPPMACPVA